MSCDLGDGDLFRAETKFTSKFTLCDNKWHNISALYDTHQIAIRIDDQPFVVALASNRNIGKLQTKSALYIGGIPGNNLTSRILMTNLNTKKKKKKTFMLKTYYLLYFKSLPRAVPYW